MKPVALALLALSLLVACTSEPLAGYVTSAEFGVASQQPTLSSRSTVNLY